METKNTNSGMILQAAVKVVRTIETVFVYTGLNDLENLIKFIGKSPLVNTEKGKISLSYKKQVITENTVIFRNSFGEVTKVISLKDFSDKYEVTKELAFAAEHINKVQEKVRKAREKKQK